MALEKISETACFGGTQGFYAHVSVSCASKMKLGVFVPPQAKTQPVPVVVYLAGLECNEQTCAQKAGAQRVAAELGLMLVTPDTSPRETRYPGDDASWDFGIGASFYVDATRAPWNASYRMHTYITRELPALVRANFNARPDAMSIMGHSMGGHGALVAALKHPTLYHSASAFAPICAPSQVPWGEKAFTHLLDDAREEWNAWDACALARNAKTSLGLLVDQGTSDKFLDAQLKPELLRAACAASGQALELRMREGYDHSYYFVSSFMEEHLRFHARHLG